MQTLAEVAGLAYTHPYSHLSLHPRYGPWFALRAVLVFDNVKYTGKPRLCRALLYGSTGSLLPCTPQQTEAGGPGSCVGFDVLLGNCPPCSRVAAAVPHWIFGCTASVVKPYTSSASVRNTWHVAAVAVHDGIADH